jgi:hypothetical protein
MPSFIALLLAVITGCGTTTTVRSAGSFVQEMHFSGAELEVVLCDLEVVKTENPGAETALVVLTVVLLPLMIFGRGGSVPSDDAGPKVRTRVGECLVKKAGGL